MKPLPYDARPRMPPEPYISTTFRLTSFATSAKEASAARAAPDQTSRAHATAAPYHSRLLMGPPSGPRSEAVPLFPPLPAGERGFRISRSLGRVQLPGQVGQGGVGGVAVAHLDAPRQLPPLHVLVVQEIQLAG